MRVLVTGSRQWIDPACVRQALEDVTVGHAHVTVVVGGAQGADAFAFAYAEHRGWDAEVFTADWNKHGKRAGMLRNQQMVDAGADVCLAFIVNTSPGATATVRMAEKAGIPTKVWRRGFERM